MKKRALALLLSLCIATAAGAAETPPGNFWDNLKTKVEKVKPKNRSTAGTAVGGVRSAKQQDDELYWKGKEKPLEADQEELNVFKQALRSVEAGKRSETIKLFEAFLAKYPESQLKDDCLKALAQLKAEK